MRPPAGSGHDSRLEGFRLVVAMAALMWVAEIVDSLADHRLDRESACEA